MPLTLVPYAERADWPFADITHLRAIALDETRGLVAIAWRDPYIANEARAVYPGHHRDHAAIFDLHTRACLARCEHASYPIHDLALHPSRPELALATGSYDGGMYFEGQLLLWNWETGAWHSELRTCREVTRVAYRDGGANLGIVVSPVSDESEPTLEEPVLIAPSPAGAGAGGWVGWRPGANAEVRDSRLENLPVVARAAIGITEESEHDAALEAARVRLGIAPRPMVWDLAWLADGRLAIALGDGTLELWRPATGEVAHVRPPVDQLPGFVSARSVTLHVSPVRGLVVHVELKVSTPPETWGRTRSMLYALEMRDDGDRLVEAHAFAHAHAVSMDASGRVLARRVMARDARHDYVLSPAGAVIAADDLGHYDVFNHALRVEGARDLYFLAGTPRKQHLKKVLYAIDADDGRTRACMPWDDPDAKRHLMDGSAVVIDDAFVARAYIVHDPKGSKDGAIELCELATGARVWRVAVEGAVIALVHWRAAGCIVASLATRDLVAIDVASGEVVHREPFAIGGAHVMVTAIAPHEEAIAFATIDGRVQIVALR